ncbi:MAG: hypothetical protein ACQEQV_10795 [Fibrobacterota bacterium]
MRYNAVLLLFVFLVGCSDDFIYNYDEIRSDMLRVIDFTFEEPDLAPGDTAVLYAAFAGRKIAAEDITWRVSWNMIFNKYGNSIVKDTTDLSLLSISEVPDSLNNGQVFRAEFIIPDSVVYWSEQIPDDISLLTEQFGIPISPKEMGLPTDKYELIDFVQAMAEDPQQLTDLPVENTGLMMEALCQLLSVRFRLIAEVPGDDVLDSYPRILDHHVRYTSRFAGVNGVYPNESPQIEDVFIVQEFLNNHQDTLRPEDGVFTIPETRGNLFFVTETESPDSVISLQSIFRALEGEEISLSEENFELSFFQEYHENGIRMVDAKTDEWTGTRYVAKITVPRKFSGQSTVWISLSDYFADFSFRPRGAVFREFRLDIE